MEQEDLCAICEMSNYVTSLQASLQLRLRWSNTTNSRGIILSHTRIIHQCDSLPAFCWTNHLSQVANLCQPDVPPPPAKEPTFNITYLPVCTRSTWPLKLCRSKVWALSVWGSHTRRSGCTTLWSKSTAWKGTERERDRALQSDFPVNSSSKYKWPKILMTQWQQDTDWKSVWISKSVKM